MRTTSIVAALCSLFVAGSASAAGPYKSVQQLRHGHAVPYQQNLTKIAVFGSVDVPTLLAALDATPLRAIDTTHARDVTVLTLEHRARQALDAQTLTHTSSVLRQVSGVRGTGPVYFDGLALTVSTGRVWVYLPSGTGVAASQAILAGMGLHLDEYVEGTRGIAIGTPSQAFVLDSFVEKLVAAGHDAVPELMRRYQPMLEPSDPYFARQWYLRNTGSNVEDAYSSAFLEAPAHADARVSEAWDTTTGSATTLVGVIDSGTDCTHPELAGKCEQPYNAITKVPDASPPPIAQDMMAGHGTAVSGIIAAPIDSAGMVGVCPECRLVPVRLIESGKFLTDAMMLGAFKHAVDAGAAVINNSWGPAIGGEFFVPVSQGEEQGLEYAGQGRGGLGTLVLYAAGNEKADTQYLGHMQTGLSNVMVVAATNHLDRRSGYSNFGAFLDVAAPTNDEYISPSMISLEIVGAGDLDQNYTHAFGGTSGATPVVSGIAALILSLDPTKTAAEVRQILRDTADKVDPDGGWYDTQGFSVLYGYGRVNAARALLAAQGLTDPACASPAPTDDCATHLDENCDGFVDESCSVATNVGLVCTDASECGPEPGWQCPSSGKVRGICTWSCWDTPCPTGSVCVLGRCAPQCNDENSCANPTDLACSDDVLGVCLRRCASDTECPTDEICDPVLQYCVLDTDGLPGSPCVADECLGSQALCLSPGMGFPDGYCTHACSVDAHCEDQGKCIATSMGSFCYKACTFDGDCRQHYVCEQAGPRAGTCYKRCDKDSQCQGAEPGWENIICDLAVGRCIDTSEPDAGAEGGADAADDVADATVFEASGDEGPVPPADAGADANTPEASVNPTPANDEDDGGCGCRTSPAKHTGAMAWAALLLGLVLARRSAKR